MSQSGQSRTLLASVRPALLVRIVIVIATLLL